ncbi:hypothetical protein FKM82_019302 [Ascaphus truei]
MCKDLFGVFNRQMQYLYHRPLIQFAIKSLHCARENISPTQKEVELLTSLRKRLHRILSKDQVIRKGDHLGKTVPEVEVYW